MYSVHIFLKPFGNLLSNNNFIVHLFFDALDPLMVVSLSSSESFQWIQNEQIVYEIFDFSTTFLKSWCVKVELSLYDILKDFSVVFTSKGWLSTEHDKENHTH
jgi:hypothetical protein